MTEQTTTLFFTSGNSDKEYRVELRAKDGLWDVTAYNGKRGKANTARVQTPEPVSYEDALKIFNTAVAKKTKEGYVDNASGTSELTDEVQRKKRVSAVQKFVPEDGFFDGWRVPDDANIVTWGGDRTELTEMMMEMDGGVCVSSMLLVPATRAQELFEKATANITAQGKDLKKSGFFEDEGEVALIALWEVPNTQYALLGVMATLQDDLESSLDFDDCTPLAFSGNDNGTHEIVHELNRVFKNIEHKNDALNLISSLVAENQGVPFEKVWHNWVNDENSDFKQTVSAEIAHYVNDLHDVHVAAQSKKVLNQATDNMGGDNKKVKM